MPIIFDSKKAVKNSFVEIAENRLARRLCDRGARVKVVHLPLKGQDEMKVDDFIVKYGSDELLKVIEDTPEWGPVGALHEMNEEAVYITHPSMVLTMPQDDHPENQSRYRPTCVSKFKTEQFADRTYFNADGKTRSTAEDWVKWPQRKKADSVTFEPGAPQFLGNQFNLWEGWGAEDVAGDVSMFTKFFDHIMQGVSPEHKKWLLQWFAYPIQHPGTRLNTAVVMWSPVQGSGKSLLGLTMKGIYGHGFREINQKQIEGGFNSWMKVAQFILADEIAGGDSRKLADWLKSTITAVDVTINEKYVPHFTLRNHCNYYFTSNHSDAFYLENYDRRYFVHEITAPPLSDDLFLEYVKWTKSEAGRNALMHFFRNVDLAGFNPHAKAPVTAAKEAMKEVSRSGVEQWCVDLFNDPDSILHEINGTPLNRDVFTADELLDIYFRQNPTASGGGMMGLKAKGISTALKKTGFKRTPDSVSIPNAPANKPKKVRLWVISNRSEFERLTGTELAALYAEQLKYTGKKKPGKRKSEGATEAAG